MLIEVWDEGDERSLELRATKIRCRQFRGCYRTGVLCTRHDRDIAPHFPKVIFPGARSYKEPAVVVDSEEFVQLDGSLICWTIE
jgi:hypothetical protein